MLQELKNLVGSVIAECEDENALDAEDMAYLEQIKEIADLDNFTDDDSGKMIALAYSAAKALGQSREWLIRKDAEWYEREKTRREQVSIKAHGDFDKGFGIGGLSRHIEPVVIPSIAAIKKMERIEREMETCRRCGASDLIDGAMFTTMAGSGCCDDCC